MPDLRHGLLAVLTAIGATAVLTAAVPPGDKGMPEHSTFHAAGRRAMEQGDLAGATDAFDRALAGGEATAELWVDIGRLRYRAGQHRLALDAAATALELGPHDPRALEFKAQLTRDSMGVIAALPWFEQAVEHAPEDLRLLGEYAGTLGEAGRHRDMLGVARRMVELDPSDPQAYYLQAVLAARAGLDDLARRLISRTGGAYDEVPAGRMLAGVLELRAGNPALAVARFDALVRSQPDNAAASLLLARALLANGEANEVVARFAPRARRADAPRYLLAVVGRAYEQLGRRADAAPFIDRAASDPRPSIAVLPDAGSAGAARSEVAQLRHLIAVNRPAEANALAAALAARYPGSIDIEIATGDVALLTGNPAAALAAYRRAAQVRRDFALIERMVAAERLSAREDAAIGLVADYLTQNPRSAAAAAMLGELMARRGDKAAAAALLEHAAALGRSPRQRADGRVAAVLARR